MAFNYWIVFEIRAEFNYKTIQNILSKGQELGIGYHKERGDVFEGIPIDLNTATNRILNIDKLYEFNEIELKIDNETYTNLLCNKYEKNQLSLWFTSMFKPNEQGLELFLAQYTTILLYMTKDFPIISINVEHDKYPIEELSHENKFYSRISSIAFDQTIFKNFLHKAIDNGVIFYRGNEPITTIGALSYEIYHLLFNNPKSIHIRFKVDNEEGILHFKRATSTFDEIIQQTDIFLNEKDSWRVGIDVNLINLKQSWIKKFSNGTEALDLAKYAKLMLDLVNGFELNELKVGQAK